MFKNLQGALFFDMGTASNDINLFNKQFIAGAGGELKLFIYFIYRVPLVLTFGMAKGLTTKGELNWYFNFGNSF
jgi:outer membrane translocation and assembly module TamA